MKSVNRKIIDYVIIVLSGFISALAYILFIVPNGFAPAGVNGIAVMIQYKLNFSVGFMSLIVNVPLCIFAFFKIDKEFSVKTFVYCLVYSVSYIIMQKLDLERFKYNAGGIDTIFPCLIAGMISGALYGLIFKINGSTGGTDIVSKYVSKKKPLLNFFWVNFVLNAIVAVISYFVYAKDVGGVITYDYKPVCLCMLYCFMSSFVGSYMIKSSKEAYRFTIICENADELAKEITTTLKHSATILNGYGAYSGKDKKIIVCAVNKHQVVDFKNIVLKYNGTFTLVETINETVGNFKKVK